MTSLREIYKCEICGNVIEIISEGAPALVCCEQAMTKLEAKTADEGKEKHVPVKEAQGDKVVVKVGSVAHPMVEEHYIKLIEVLTEDKVLRAELKPGQAPEAVFSVDAGSIVSVREYCTVHGLWVG